jgi:hypothetical protein
VAVEEPAQDRLHELVVELVVEVEVDITLPSGREDVPIEHEPLGFLLSNVWW